MRVESVLQKLFGTVLYELDVRHVRNLFSAVSACLQGRRLVMMELARHWPGAIKVYAPLKRLDRLLSNPRVQAVRRCIYRQALSQLIRAPCPVVIVDWSELKHDGRWHLLRAALAMRGRTMTLYEEVYPQRLLNSARAHKRFLVNFKALVPEGVCPVVITDAGFKVPWFRQVDKLGWHWLGRVRGHVHMSLAGDAPQWRSVKDWFALATRKAQKLGAVLLTMSHGFSCQATLVKQAPKQRLQTRRDGKKAIGGRATKMARAGREPWLLVSSNSLARYSARQIVRWYALRMQIEQGFRDLKSHRYGCAFEDTQTRSPARLEMLLLIHMLATLLAWLQGLSTPGEKRFKVSLVRRGWEQCRIAGSRLNRPLSQLLAALQQLTAETAHPT